VVDAIAAAQSSIYIAVHEFSLPGIAHALAEREAAGVTVRVVIENSYSTPMAKRGNPAAFAQLDQHYQAKASDLYTFIDANQDGVLSGDELGDRDALTILAQANIPLIDDTADGSKGSGLMHHKFMVIDGRTVVTGSANWTLSGVHGDFTDPDSRGNANSLLVIDSQPLAQRFQQEFNLMWGDGPGGQKDSLFGLQKPHRSSALVSTPGSAMEVQFSPTSSTQPWAQSVNGLIAKTLGQATQSIHLALFVFSEQAISNQLLPVAQRGVPISVLIDPSFAYRSYSEGLDLLGVKLPDHNCKQDDSIPWSNPITTVGVPALPSGDKLHHKFAVLDQTTVLVGSQNWSQAANTTNDENLLVIRNATVAAHFEREFQRLYDGAELGMTPRLQAAIARQTAKCGL
jgi:phosphatidylserine/phosphatidylglycerophosphate/cardiolipin synthase-like enzyme